MELVDALVLNNLARVGNVAMRNILQFADSHSAFFLEELADKFSQNLPPKGIPATIIDFLQVEDFSSSRDKVQRDLTHWREQGIEVVQVGADFYPSRLLGVESPPPFLFCAGNLELLRNSRAIAVVGTRGNTSKGAIITQKTVEAFSKQDFVIVSGLALGIDAIAHQSALDAGAPTIAVVVDLIKVSPAANKGLAKKILRQDGLLISENPPGAPTIPALFAKRDRIQAGLSAAVFAIETSIDGGTMHAVNAAIKLGRPVFVPDAVSAKYEDFGIKAIEGTQDLVRNAKARTYTSASYQEISNELAHFFEKNTNLDATSSQGELPI